MSKSTKKRRSYNTDVIKALSAEYEVSEQFVRQAIRKDKTSLTAESINKKYFQLIKPTEKAIKKFKRNPIKH